MYPTQEILRRLSALEAELAGKSAAGVVRPQVVTVGFPGPNLAINTTCLVYTPVIERAFTPITGGTGRVRVTATLTAGNSDNTTVYGMAMGIKAVPHGSPAPSTADYPSAGENAVDINDPGQAQIALVMEYGGFGGMPGALTPGTEYDFYLMATATVGGDVEFVPANGAQMSIEDVL